MCLKIREKIIINRFLSSKPTEELIKRYADSLEWSKRYKEDAKDIRKVLEERNIHVRKEMYKLRKKEKNKSLRTMFPLLPE